MNFHPINSTQDIIRTMPTFPKAQRFYSTPTTQQSRIPIFDKGQPNSPSITNKTAEPTEPVMRDGETPSPWMFKAASNAGHTPHPSSVTHSPQTVTEMQVVVVYVVVIDL